MMEHDHSSIRVKIIMAFSSYLPIHHSVGLLALKSIIIELVVFSILLERSSLIYCFLCFSVVVLPIVCSEEVRRIPISFIHSHVNTTHYSHTSGLFSLAYLKAKAFPHFDLLSIPDGYNHLKQVR